MPAAMNIRARKAPSIAAMLRHDFREYAPDAGPAHVDPSRTQDNRVLQGSREALDDLPTRQPDRKDKEGRLRRGRKIRSDANVAGSVVLTLPKEIDPEDEERVQAWTQETLRFLHEEMPGQLAYAVLHRDESRPHIHAAVVPIDERGHLSWKRHFDRKVFQRLQTAYSACLAALGVHPTPEAEKTVRAAGYTQGIHGWRAGRAVLDAQERVQEAERQIQERERELEALSPELKKVAIVRPRLFANKDAYWTELERRWAELQQQVTAWRGQNTLLAGRLQAREQTISRLTDDIDRLARMLLEQAPDKERPAIARKVRDLGVQAAPAERVLAKEHLWPWQQPKDHDRGIGR